MVGISEGLAYDAIDEWVCDRWPDWCGNWREIVPSGAEWGYEQRSWRRAAGRIVANFNRRLPNNQNISVPTSAKDHFRTLPLVEFEAYLAAKAEHYVMRRRIRAMERRIREFEAR